MNTGQLLLLIVIAAIAVSIVLTYALVGFLAGRTPKSSGVPAPDASTTSGSTKD